MANFKVKKKFIGSTVFVQGVGQITIKPEYAEMLAKHGRTELLEGIKPAAKLKPLKELTKKELQEKAKDHPEYSSKLNKEELIDLINDPA